MMSFLQKSAIVSTTGPRGIQPDLDSVQEGLEVLEPKRTTSGYRLCSVTRPEQTVRASRQRPQDL